MGMRKPVSVVNHWSTVDQIVNIAAITALAAASAPELKEEANRQHLLDRIGERA